MSLTPITKFVIVERRIRDDRFVALRNLSFASKEAGEDYIVEHFNASHRHRFSVETRIVKPDDAANRMTCQCCGRKILANLGSIALHGYERPEHGWQTGSCAGAKEDPFEVSRDKLGRLLKKWREQLVRMQEIRTEIAAERAIVTHRYSVYDRNLGRSSPHALIFDRASFASVVAANPKAFDSYRNYDFDHYKARDLEIRASEIGQMERAIAEQQARYDSWKQTHERKGGQWATL